MILLRTEETGGAFSAIVAIAELGAGFNAAAVVELSRTFDTEFPPP